jgi:hypothetical protein
MNASRRMGGVLLLGLAAVAGPALAAADPELERLRAQLGQLQADPALARQAAFEQLEAQQALAALEQARRSDRPEALYLAGRRVEIATVAAGVAAARNELAQLERQRNELLLEASRRETERARQEAERLRLQAQIQAEEAERLRLAAEEEAALRTEAEAALGKATGRQTATLSAARRKEAELARQEAELVSGKKLPTARFEGNGEVYTLPGNAFAAGRSSFNAGGRDAVEALAEYLKIAKGNVRVLAWDNDSKVAQARAAALRQALVGAGVPAARVSAEGRRGAVTTARSAEVAVGL